MRPLADRQLFLNSMCNVLPQFLDSKDESGIDTPGLFPMLATTIGEGSFDHANRAIRWRSFLASGSQAAAEFSSEYTKGKELHAAIISQTNLPAGTDRPASIFDQSIDHFGLGIKKVHKAIQDERQKFKAELIGDRARNLPADDARRMAFQANSACPLARQLLGSLPVSSVPFTPLEWTTAVALHMGVPIPALKNRIGERIRNNSNSAFISVDHFGYNLTRVGGVEGGGTQRNHNAIARVISASLSSAGIKHRGGTTDTTCKTIFRAATPNGPINEDAGKQVNSIIPDLATFTKNISWKSDNRKRI